MTIIEKDGIRFLVDIEKTRRYYRDLTPCTCRYCRHLYSHIQGVFPELEAFLSEFGIDIAKPDETAPFETEDSFFYSFAGYTVCGKTVSAPTKEIRIAGQPGFTVLCEEGVVFPNEQAGEYFSLSVSAFELPVKIDRRKDSPETTDC